VIRIGMPLCLAALLLFVGGRSSASDSLEAFRNDPSPQMGQRLSALYEKIESPDQRFWLLQAFSFRLKEFGEELSLETLLDASEDNDPTVRGTALKGLIGFEAISSERLLGAWIARIDLAASRGIESKLPTVRENAVDLKRALDVWKDPSLKKDIPRPAPYVYPSRGIWPAFAGILRWLWLAVIPLCALIWIVLGVPVFDAETHEGRLAKTAWRVVSQQRAFLAGVFVLWLLLATLLAGYGFDLLVLVLGKPLYTPAGNWFRAYLAVSFCIFGPGVLLAAAISRNPGGSAAVGALRYFPHAIAMTLVVFVFLFPFEVLYRFFLRRVVARDQTRPADFFEALMWSWEIGSMKSAYLASAIMVRERRGLIPAMVRALTLMRTLEREESKLNLASFDLRFGMLGAAPMLAALCALVARGLPVQWAAPFPIILGGCSVWAWSVLAGVLIAMVQMLRGALLAAKYLKSVDVELGEDLSALASESGEPSA